MQLHDNSSLMTQANQPIFTEKIVSQREIIVKTKTKKSKSNLYLKQTELL